MLAGKFGAAVPGKFHGGAVAIDEHAVRRHQADVLETSVENGIQAGFHVTRVVDLASNIVEHAKEPGHPAIFVNRSVGAVEIELLHAFIGFDGYAALVKHEWLARKECCFQKPPDNIPNIV